MSTELTLDEVKAEWHGSLKSYLIGFFLSLALTLASFLIVAYQLLSGQILIYTIIGLAVLQAIGQLLFFLHLGKEARPRWETVIFIFMLVILLVIVFGTLWIMHDLNERVMPDMTKEMRRD